MERWRIFIILAAFLYVETTMAGSIWLFNPGGKGGLSVAGTPAAEIFNSLPEASEKKLVHDGETGTKGSVKISRSQDNVVCSTIFLKDEASIPQGFQCFFDVADQTKATFFFE